jgi:hypothetical protein
MAKHDPAREKRLAEALRANLRKRKGLADDAKNQTDRLRPTDSFEPGLD